MQNKTTYVEKYLLDRINSGEYAPGSKIPSQHQLMSLCGCSRITVQRALKLLINDGFLRTGKGSGTFVLPRMYKAPFREIVVVCEGDPFYKPGADMLPDFLPIRWINVDSATRNSEKFFAPGQAVIWSAAKENCITLMQYLRSRGIAQLLINRSYENFDYVTLDSVASIAEGLCWLHRNAGKEVAFITHNPDYNRPYLAERVTAFYEACIATNTILFPEWIFRKDFSDRKSTFAEIGKTLFSGSRIPRALCVLHMDLVADTVKCAGTYGLTLGKDYFILNFDMCHALKNNSGIAMMLQSKELFRDGIVKWLEYRASGNGGQFSCRIKTELLINK